MCVNFKQTQFTYPRETTRTSSIKRKRDIAQSSFIVRGEHVSNNKLTSFPCFVIQHFIFNNPKVGISLKMIKFRQIVSCKCYHIKAVLSILHSSYMYSAYIFLQEQI